MRTVLLRLLPIAGAVVALDQWTKHWATHVLAFRPPIDVIGTLVRLTYTRNSGVAFGIGAGTGFPYYIFSVIAAVAILWLLLRGRVTDLPRQVALSLIFGGAIGNLIDRVSAGEVVDFILLSWRHWSFPVFNVADSAVTVGVALFALAATRTGDAGDATGATDDGAPPAPPPALPPPAEDAGARDPDAPGAAARGR